MATGQVDVEETPASGAVTLKRSRTRRGSRDGTASSSSVTDLSGCFASGIDNGGLKYQSEGEGEGAGDGCLDHNVDGTGEINGYAEATDRNRETLPIFELLFSKPSNSGTEKRLVSNSIVLSDEDIEELDLEGIVEDSEAYDFYCPNCNCCLKKVVARKKKQASRPLPHVGSVDVFRCTSCFSFLFIAGRRFVSLFSPGPMEDTIDQDPGNILGQDLPGGDSVVHHLYAPGEVNSDGNVHLSSVHASSSETQECQKDNTAIVNLVPGKADEGTVNFRNKLEDAKGKDSGFHAPDVANAASSDQSKSISSNQIVDLLPIKASIKAPDYDPGELNEVRIKVSRGSKGDMQETNTGPVEPAAQSSQVLLREPASLETDDSQGWDVLKSIVYGGLVETITSLGVVASAAAANSNTANIAALSAANLVGGLVVLCHCLWELKSDGPRRISHQSTEQQVNQYQELLGCRDNFPLHATASVLSFLVFGIVPLLTYAFSFGESNERELKLAAAMAISLFCIIVLAAGKAHTQNQPRRVGQYVKTILDYVCTGVAVSGLSYIVGALIMKLIDRLGLFKAGEVVQLGGGLQFFSTL